MIVSSNLRIWLEELIFPDYKICSEGVYEKPTSKWDEQKRICENMKQRLFRENPEDVSKINTYYDKLRWNSR